MLAIENLPGKSFLSAWTPDESPWALQHLSDYLRYAWLFLYGGTCWAL